MGLKTKANPSGSRKRNRRFVTVPSAAALLLAIAAAPALADPPGIVVNDACGTANDGFTVITGTHTFQAGRTMEKSFGPGSYTLTQYFGFALTPDQYDVTGQFDSAYPATWTNKPCGPDNPPPTNVPPTVTTAKVCPNFDTGKLDGNGKKTITVNAPAGKLIQAVCLKAGSINQGNGAVIFTYSSPVASVTLSHPSGKDIGDYSVDYVPAA